MMFSTQYTIITLIYFLNWRGLMEPTVSHNLNPVKTRQETLPLALRQRIQTQVSERQTHFIQQILQTGSSFTTCQVQNMETDSVQKSDPDALLHSHKKQTGKDANCLSEESGKAKFSKQDVRHSEKRKGKRGRNELSASSDDARGKRKPPNYFVAVQIADPQIHSAAKRIQEGVMQASDVDISSTRIEPIKFHITLMVMHLEGEEAKKRAEETLEKLGPILAEKLGDKDVSLEFKGLSTFGGGRVLFSPPQPSEGLDHLHAIAEEVSAQMKENGIVSTDQENKVFNPHLTLFKFKYDRDLFRKGIRKLKSELYSPFMEEYLGTQTFSSLQLCEMGDDKREDGYYLVSKEVSWRTTLP